MPTDIRIKVRRDSTARWLMEEAKGKLLSVGEIIYDTTENRLKIGMGGSFSETPYLEDDDTIYIHPEYPAQTGKPTGNETPAFGGSFTVSQITSDATGHVTGATDRTITIPSTVATTSAAGLMSAADKTKLNGMTSGIGEAPEDGNTYVRGDKKWYKVQDGFVIKNPVVPNLPVAKQPDWEVSSILNGQKGGIYSPASFQDWLIPNDAGNVITYDAKGIAKLGGSVDNSVTAVVREVETFFHGNKISSGAALTTSNYQELLSSVFRVAYSPELGYCVGVGYAYVYVGTYSKKIYEENRCIVVGDTTSSFHDICWSPALKLFVACGESNTKGVFACSPDGITWITTVLINTETRVYNVIWCDALNVFVAFGEGGMYISADGRNWEIHGDRSPLLHYGPMAWSPSKKLLCGVRAVSYDHVQNTWTVNAYLSSDLENWVEATLPSGTPLGGRYGLAWSSTRNCFVYTSQYSSVIYTLDPAVVME